jgi:hypothetical protein
MSISQNFPEEGPTLNLNFAGSRTLDPRITFTRTQTTSNGSTYMGRDGLIKYAGPNEPRFDHRYVNGEIESLGLLIEEGRTNLTQNSETLTDYSNQRVSNSTVTTGGPFGTGYHEKTITVVGGQYNFHSSNQISLTTGQTITFSIFFKNISIDPNQIYLRCWTGSGRAWTTQRQVRYNLSTLTATDSTGTIVNKSIQAFPDGWYRLSMTVTADQNGFAAESFLTDNNSIGTKYQIMGAQVEVGSFPTSYIPTEGSTKTRNPDNASITGSNFTEWYNQSEGSVYCAFKLNSTATARVFNIDDGTNTNRISGLVGSSLYQTFINPAAAGPTASFSNIFDFKIASGHQDNNIQVYVNSIYQNSNTSITIPKNLNTFRIGNWHNGTFQGTTISQLTYYPTRLTNTQLQTLTK